MYVVSDHEQKNKMSRGQTFFEIDEKRAVAFKYAYNT